MTKTKNRMITVRVSEEEFERMRTISRSMGYRSVSDLTRAAMHNVTHEDLSPQDDLSSRLETFEARLARLAREVERLSATLNLEKPRA